MLRPRSPNSPRFRLSRTVLGAGLGTPINSSFVDGVVAPGWNVSRGTNATRVGPTGLVEWAPANEVSASNAFTNSWWNGRTASLTQGFADPFGGAAAWRMLANAGGAGSYPAWVRTFSAPFAVGAKRILSVYAKADTSSFLAMRMTGGGSQSGNTDVYIGFNLSTGVTTSVTPTDGTIHQVDMQSVGNGWWRCWVSYTPGAGATGLLDIAVTPTAAYNTGVAYAGTEAVLIYGAQLERATVANAPSTLQLGGVSAIYAGRIDYDPVTLACRGLLVECQSTNMLSASTDQTNATQWPNQINSSRTRNQVCPDGTSGGTLVTVTTSSGARNETGNISITSGVVYTASVFMKAGTSNGGLSLGDGGGTVYASVKATLSGAGSVVVAGSGATAAIERHANGWYRVSLTYTSATTTVRVALHPWDGSADQLTYPAGAVGASCSFWGVQLEQLGFSTSFIPTDGAAATRGGENIATLAVYRSGNFSCFVDAEFRSGSLLYPAFCTLGTRSGLAGNWFTPFVGPANALSFESKVSGTTYANTPAQPALPARLKSVARMNGSTMASCVNGGVISSTATPAMPATTHFSLGTDNARQVSDAASSLPPVRFRRVTLYTSALTDAQMQSLTL